MSATAHVLVVGRFSPLHAGHLHLLQTAHDHAVALYVLSYANPEVAGCAAHQRRTWLDALRSRLPRLAGIEVRVGAGVPHDDAPAVAHRSFCADVVDQLGWPIDAVATSEAYGPGFAAHLSVAFSRPVCHLAVDPLRRTVPISGTRLRAAPHRHRDFVAPEVFADWTAARPEASPSPITPAALYDTFLGRHEEAPEVVAFLLRLGIGAGARVLDAGCGTGRLLQPLQAAGFRPTGLDSDRDFVAAARETGLPVFHGRFEDAPMLPERFDVLLMANGPLVYVRTAAARMRSWRALTTRLVPGATLVLDLPDLPWIWQHTYTPPSPQTRSIGPIRVTRTPSHIIDAESGRWEHIDQHTFDGPAPTPPACEARFTFVMLDRATLAAELVAAGFRDLAWWGAWTADTPGGPRGPRHLVTARWHPHSGASP